MKVILITWLFNAIWNLLAVLAIYDQRKDHGMDLGVKWYEALVTIVFYPNFYIIAIGLILGVVVSLLSKED